MERRMRPGILVLVSVVGLTACSTTDSANDDIGRFLLHLNNESASGENNTHFYDFSGEGNNGSCSGSNCSNWTTQGKLGGAFEFDGEGGLEGALVGVE